MCERNKNMNEQHKEVNYSLKDNFGFIRLRF